jgi:hypothetical protein
MAAGGPGDHWRTEIFSWDRPAFGEPTDSLIREIGALGGARLLDDDEPLGKRLWDLWPQWGRVDREALRELTRDLTVIRDQLKLEAVERGWEVD